MAIFHDAMGTNYALAKIAALGLAFAWNYLSRKTFLFRVQRLRVS
jgi:putative flippase GtrA